MRSPQTPLAPPPCMSPPPAPDINIPVDDEDMDVKVKNAHARLLLSQRIYHSLMILITVIAVVLAIYFGTKVFLKKDHISSSFVLPAAWAIYNSIGPIIYLLSVKIQKTKKLGLWIHILKFVSGP